MVMVGISKYSIPIDSIGHQKQSVYEESVNLVLSISPIFLFGCFPASSNQSILLPLPF